MITIIFKAIKAIHAIEKNSNIANTGKANLWL